jgi:class 3 adenylate cyclase
VIPGRKGRETAMAEHVPPRVVVAIMAVFFAAMAVCALAFWIAAVVIPGGVSGVIGLIGYAVTTIFGTLHILAAITGVLLWQWERHRLRPLIRVALEAATVYFCLAVLVSIFFNLLATTILDRIL